MLVAEASPERRTADDAPVSGPSPHRPAAHPVAHATDEAPNDQGRRHLLDALAGAYGGECQICSSGFRRRTGEPYFEIELLSSALQPTDCYRLGNALCLCPTCTAKLRYGSVQGLNIPAFRGLFDATNRQAVGQSRIAFTLCGEQVELRYVAEHLDDLRAMLEKRPDEDLGFEEEPDA